MALALGLGGLVKGATGMGLPIIALPILASFLGVQHAVALMCVPVVVTNLWQIWRFRADYRSADFLPPMFVGGIAGIAIGTWLLTSLPERALSFALAVLVIAYVGLGVLKPHFHMPRPLGLKLAPLFGLGAGVLQGATGVGSPLSVTFIHAMRLWRTAHVFAVSAMFLLLTIVQMPALAVAGVLTWTILLEGAVAIVPAFLAMQAGNRLAARLSPKAFDRIVLAVLALIAVELLVKSLAP
jgi:uncharacterized membrane protein YfcA